MTFGSLFAGIGGMDLGLDRAGMVCRWQVEIDPFCRTILEKHWPGVPKYGDIRQLSGSELETVDLICGGYPCQPFSQAGKRGGAEDPRHLWPEFARLLRILGPRWVLLENVSGHLSLGFGEVLRDLAGLGYDAEWTCLRASDFGASHLRKRVFVVAHSNRESSDIHGRDGNDLGDSNGRQREQRGRSIAEQGDVLGSNGGCSEVGNATGARPARREDAGTDSGHAGQDRRGREELERGSNKLADAASVQPQFSAGIGTRSGHQESGRSLSESPGRCDGIPFAPGPTDPRWPGILTERPDLAPALESTVRRVADGLPDWLVEAMSDRTKRLSRLGNAVVPQVTEWIGRKIMNEAR